MPKEITIWKLFLIACIVGFAAAAVSISHAENADTIVQTNAATVAPRAALPMCPSAQVQMSRPVDAIYKRYLGQTPISRMVVR